MLFTVPPESASVGVFLEEFSSLLRETVICPQQLLIYGDFNFHIDDKADKGATRLGELLDLFNLKQHVCLSTHKRGHILDLVIKRNETESALSLKNVTVVEQFISDHKAVCFNLSLRKPVNERSTVVSRKLKGSDFDAFNEMIISTGLSDGGVSHCIELLAKKYDVSCCARLWKSWHLKELALLSFDRMPLGIMRRSPLRKGRGEGSNVNGVRLVSKLIG